MRVFAASDVSQHLTAICVFDSTGTILSEAKVPPCPDAIAAFGLRSSRARRNGSAWKLGHWPSGCGMR